MTTTTYGVYMNNGSTDGSAVASEEIDDGLRDDEKASRIGELFTRVTDENALTSGRTWVIQKTSLAS